VHLLSRRLKRIATLIQFITDFIDQNRYESDKLRDDENEEKYKQDKKLDQNILTSKQQNSRGNHIPNKILTYIDHLDDFPAIFQFLIAFTKVTSR